MVHVGRGRLAKIAAQPLQTALGRGTPRIIARGMARAQRRDNGSVVIVMLQRGPATLSATPSRRHFFAGSTSDRGPAA